MVFIINIYFMIQVILAGINNGIYNSNNYKYTFEEVLLTELLYERY